MNIGGNNARAYLDTDNDNGPDAGGAPVTDGVFDTSFNATTKPSEISNKEVAVQNLFYLNNLIHDTLYKAGFNEQAGNFQQDNYGKGGRAGDPVAAEAQDGGGTDNANFATPADGQDPRMQMYLWSVPGMYQVNVPSGPAAGNYDAASRRVGTRHRERRDRPRRSPVCAPRRGPAPASLARHRRLRGAHRRT